jgi:hypothetical protein
MEMRAKAARAQVVEHVDQLCPKRAQGLSTGDYIRLAALNRAAAPTSKAQLAHWYRKTILTRLLPASAAQLSSQAFWNLNLIWPISRVRLAMTLWAEWRLHKSQNLFAELLAAFGIGQAVEEFLPAEALHLAESFLDSAPISNRLLKPLILLLGQGDANRLAFDLACPGIASASGTWSPILHVSFTNPAGLGQLRLKPGVFLLAGRRRGSVLSVHE